MSALPLHLRWQQRRALLQLGLVALLACSSAPRIPGELLQQQPKAAAVAGGHRGPEVVAGDSGPARFAKALLARFDVERAMATVRFVDGFYRAPGNDGFEASLDHVEALLREAGYGARDGLRLEVLTTELDSPAWTPLSARVELESAGAVRVLHAFDTPEAPDRTMLPVNAPSGVAEARPVFAPDELAHGEILVVRDLAFADPRAAAERGASALLVASLEHYNDDPTGKGREQDALQFRSLRRGSPIPVLQISRRSFAAIQAAVRADPATKLRVRAEVRTDTRPLRTLVATVVGADRPDECVVTVAHVQEPGAVDNASGVGGICEVACTLAALLEAPEASAPSGLSAPSASSAPSFRPSRSVVFLFGDEMRESRVWLDAKKLKTVAAVSADMIGASRERTGALPLLERGPDPAAVKELEPDRHTAWGRAHVEYADLCPNGVNVVVRTALADVGLEVGGWETDENPYEGGSDHDVFLREKIPAALLWHFTDFAYHTSLDRLDHVDPEELRRMACAVAAAVLALADPRPGDLDRYLRTNLAEKKLRIAAAKEAKDEELAREWEKWSESTRQWFRRECLRLASKEAPLKKD